MTVQSLTKRTIPYSGIGSLIGPEDLEAVRRALMQDDLCSGHYVGQFEQAFAVYCGSRYAIACSNCTTGLEMATGALGLTGADEVITTPITFIATTLPLLKRKVRVVFADIDPRTYNIDPASIRRAITSRTRAIYVVHYGGLAADMDAILAIAREHGLKVVEDAAHSPGATYKGRKVGSIGDITCFSFQSLKNMTTLGDGGMVTTNDEILAEKMRRLRTFGIEKLPDRTTKYGQREKSPPFYWDVVDDDGEVGLNFRMSEPEASVGLVQLAKLDRMNDRRIEIGQKLNDGFGHCHALTVPYTPADCRHVFHLYTLRVDEAAIGSKDTFMEVLDKEYGVDLWTQYCPTYLYTVYRRRGYKPGLCPVAEHVFLKGLVNLPIYPALTEDQIDYMIDAVLKTVSRLSSR